ncbi:MAG: leucine--tRNA ligase [Ferroplasma sp.]|uniref:leucine--tRNA ligase n=1 Tax=Ferroplasma sp. TaxID=2591003 RepID=UPI002816857D|nr:leucine--tRNA ligase [Ferroplasma sp.]WMT51156.1 MAG: leucine--tRNA ligase [Ferroplasma sp.]
MERSIEEKWRDRWAESHIFEPVADSTREKFFVTVPWPYTNGSLHVGHGRTYTLGDIVARYKRLTGYNVLFPMGFHESGTPILAFSERLRNGDKDTIRLYRSYLSEYEKPEDIDGILASFREPQNIADYFSRVIIKDFMDLGYSIDWSRKFTSADPFYQEVVKWQFNQLNGMGLIKRGSYPILYSMKDENAVGEDDIKDGDTDKVSIEEFTGVLFRGEKYSLMAASLRPETIFGVTNLWISPSAEYGMVRYREENVVMSSSGCKKFSMQHEDVQYVRDISSDEIAASEFQVPFSSEKVGVLKAEFVDPDNGTGIVYSVPGHSIFDYIYYRKEGIKNNLKKVVKVDRNVSVESLVQKYDLENNSERLKDATQELYKEEFYNGTLINSGKYSGMSVEAGREAIRKEMLERNIAYIFYETTRKAVTRSGSEVIVAVLNDQWFIDYSPEWLKEKAHLLVNSMKFYPELYRKLMNDAVDWLKERPCARRRGIGTRLPFDERWVIESLSDSTIYMLAYTNKTELENIYAHLKKIPYGILDYILLGKEVTEEYDEYTMENARKARDEFRYWYGNDLRITAPPHISNHLAFYIMNHAAIFKGKELPGGLMISGLVISNGAKISKSKGNVISLLEIINHYSADIYRLFMAAGADISSLLDWNEKDLSSVIKRYSYFTDILDAYSPGDDDGNYIYSWFKSAFYRNLKTYIADMESMNIRDSYIAIFYNVMNDLKNVENHGGNINTAMKPVLADWLKALSPIIPFAAEEYWHRHIDNNSFVSAQRLDMNIDDRIDYSVLKSENYLNRVISDIREILKIIHIDAKKATITVYGQKQKIFLEEYPNGNLDREYRTMIGDYMKNKNRIDIEMIDEYNIIEANRKYLESSLKLDITVVKSDSIQKKNPWPGRPLIEIS